MNFYTGNPLLLLTRAFKHGKPSQRVIAAFSLFLIVIGFLLTFLFFGIQERIGQALLLMATFFLLILDSSFRTNDQEKIERKIDQAEKALVEHPDKTRPLWDIARTRLELYFERNLSQIKAIFWLTILVMCVGFGMVIYGVNLALESQSFNQSLLSVISGVITEFIGASFLVIYKSTMAQAAEYVKTLERINAVGMAIQVVDQIPEDNGELKNQVRAKLVTDILGAFGATGTHKP